MFLLQLEVVMFLSCSQIFSLHCPFVKCTSTRIPTKTFPLAQQMALAFPHLQHRYYHTSGVSANADSAITGGYDWTCFVSPGMWESALGPPVGPNIPRGRFGTSFVGGLNRIGHFCAIFAIFWFAVAVFIHWLTVAGKLFKIKIDLLSVFHNFYFRGSFVAKISEGALGNRHPSVLT